MSQIGEQKQRIEDVRSAQYITGALRDISAVELKKLRKKFERNSMFYTELSELFQLVWRIGQEQGVKDVLNKKQESEIFIAYTTNRHFYGSLNHDVILECIKNTDSKNTCLIIGDTGKQIWLSRAQKRKEIAFLSFTGDEPNKKELDGLLERVSSYNHVYVFYPGFTSVFRQDVQMVDITYKPSASEQRKEEFKDLPQYLLEPDLSEMVSFFNTQVRYALLERLLLETQLSRVSARLVKMDTAGQNAEELIHNETRELRRVRTSFSSRRMLETVVGFIQWHNRKTQLIGR